MRTQAIRRLALLSAGPAASQVALAVLQLFALIYLSPKLGLSGYGQLSVMSAVFTIIVLLDLGIPSAVESRLARSQSPVPHRTVAAAWMALAPLSAVGLGVSTLMLAVAWDDTQTRQVALAALVAFLAAPFTVGLRSRMPSGSSATSGVLSVCAIAVSIALVVGLGDRTLTVEQYFLALYAPRVIANIIDTLLVFGAQLRIGKSPFARWSRKEQREESRLLRRFGLGVWSIQVVALVSYQLDTLIVAAVLDTEAVGEFAAATRIMGVIPMCAGVLLASLWSTFARISGQDLAVQAVTRTAVAILVVAATYPVVLLGVLPSLVDTAFGEQVIQIEGLLFLWAWIWSVTVSLGGIGATYLNARGLARSQLVPQSIAAVCNIALSFFLARELGAEGPILGSLAAFLLIVFPSMVLAIRRDLRQFQLTLEAES